MRMAFPLSNGIFTSEAPIAADSHKRADGKRGGSQKQRERFGLSALNGDPHRFADRLLDARIGLYRSSSTTAMALPTLSLVNA